MTKNIEVAFLLEDHTWDTGIVEITWDSDSESVEVGISRFFEIESSKGNLDGVVQVVLYNDNPDSYGVLSEEEYLEDE